MSLSAVLYFSLAVATFIIGVHQTFVYGVAYSYWLFMATAAGLLLYRRQLLREREEEQSQKPPPPPEKKSPPISKKRPRKQ